MYICWTIGPGRDRRFSFSALVRYPPYLPRDPSALATSRLTEVRGLPKTPSETPGRDPSRRRSKEGVRRDDRADTFAEVDRIPKASPEPTQIPPRPSQGPPGPLPGPR